jgi:hypothetical protein
MLLNGLTKHANRKKHQANNAIAYPKAQQGNPPTQTHAPQGNPPTETQVCNKATDDHDGNPNTDMSPVEDIAKDGPQTNVPTEPMDTTEPMDLCQPTAPTNPFPKINMVGNEWLHDLFKDTKMATKEEVNAAFEKPALQNMKSYYVSEYASGENRCGGGLMYLAAKAFQQANDSRIDEAKYPDYEESKWQMNYMIHYQSMNEKQRKRQSQLTETLINLMPSEDSSEKKFFKETFLPPYHQLGRYYGTSGQHSMYNGLPVPRAVDVGGVAYTSPLAIIAFVMANGIPIDDIYVTADTVPGGTTELRRVHTVDECQKATAWYGDIQRNYYGSESGAPNSNSGAPKFPAVICLHLSDWTDGFDSGKVKSNRSAIQSKTFTVSPPKHLANATDNTFPVALGLKKAAGWKKVEGLFRKEVEELTQSTEPIMFYHGVLQKMVPCFFKRFAVLADKQERNGLTGTLGCGSNLHKCFGVSGNIQTPSCRIPELQEFLNRQRSGANKTASYGWSDDFIEPNKNGGVFPACKDCRMRGLMRLLGLKVVANKSPCAKCHNWDLIAPPGSPNVLTFPAHNHYPKLITPGSPVPPPKGRDVFGEDVQLPVLSISWELMIQACKFAFYQASRPKGRAWTKQSTTCYLKHCCVSANLADLLYDAAKKASKSLEAVDFNMPDKIGTFQFDPAWLSTEITIQDFIEAVMHQLFLGAAESNYELITTWLTKLPADSKLGHSGFLNALQELIKDLRGFHLSWLIAYPLTGVKGRLGTGSWVAENWVFLVRVSQFIFGWCCKDHESTAKYGVDDMSRLVVAFHAFVARCLTHSGIDEEGIKEAELYLKEFLSALREFDVRIRHEKLNKTTERVSELKGTEAWWLKPNYMSLRNLILILRVLGPLVLWWDGGGRGERFIQVVKPHIKRGVRGDALLFFVSLLEKLFRVRLIDILDKRCETEIDTTDGEEEDLLELLDKIADELGVPPNGDESEMQDNGSDVEEDPTESHHVTERADSDDEEDEDGIDSGSPVNPAYFSPSEVHGMTKTKAFFIYRNEKQLIDGLSLHKPLTGIVAVNITEDGRTAFEFQVVFRKPVKQLARRKVLFKDREGISFHGMWCAPISVEEEELPAVTDLKELQTIAKLSAVAIPLWYVVGKNHKNSHKYCVITNWWKYRMADSSYQLPRLDPKMYTSVQEKHNIDKLFKKATKAAGRVQTRNAETYGVI